MTHTPSTTNQLRPTHRPLLNAAEVAAWLNITEARVYELARGKILPAVRMGRQVRFDPVRVEAWINSGGEALPGGWRQGAGQ